MSTLMSLKKNKGFGSFYYPTLPVEGGGARQHKEKLVIGLALGLAYLFKRIVGYSWITTAILGGILYMPALGIFIWVGSWISKPPAYSRSTLPNQPIETYMEIVDQELKAKYKGYTKIPMEEFFESYFDGKINIKGDCRDIFEQRYDWAKFGLTVNQVRFFLTQFLPELLFHSKKQDEDQVRDHYDRGDDFYRAFLGEPMVYTSGLVGEPTKKETIDELQKNKLHDVCTRLQLQKGEKHLDIGCGWGTLVNYAAKEFGTQSTGVTLGRNQATYGKEKAKELGNEKNAEFLCMDYREIPAFPLYNKISCLEMAEHVGIRRFSAFLMQVRDMLEDDGLFYLQIAGLRAAWQYEDFVWGLFMAKYVFPGADASCPLYWVIDKLEHAGFEVRSVDTIGVHYSVTIGRWYECWLENKEAITSKYGKKWFRVWEVFLAWSVIIARQGSSTCYQILAHKNLNQFDRSSLIRKPL